MAGNNTYSVTLGSGGPDIVIADTFSVTPDGTCVIFSTLSPQQQTGQPLNYAGTALFLKSAITGITTLAPAATPTFSPAGGSYSGAQTVTISCATAGATIYYTLDGSTPTTSSSQYSTPVSRTLPGTINAIATASGYATSAVGSATYITN